MANLYQWASAIFRKCPALACAAGVFASPVAGAAEVKVLTDEKAGRAMCEIFLSGAIFGDTGALKSIPLATGRLPKTVDELTLFSRADAENYLQAHPHYIWARDLRSSLEFLSTGENIIYLSEIGPTLWRLDEFGVWANKVTGPLSLDPAKARAVLVKLARGESVADVSEAAAVRVRNSFLARSEALKVEAEYRMRYLRYRDQQQGGDARSLGSIIFGTQARHPHETPRQSFWDRMLGLNERVELPPDPVTGEPENLANVAPEERALMSMLNFELNGTKMGNQAARQIREESPSLRLPWAHDFKLRDLHKIKSLDEVQSIKPDEDVIWIMRSLFREELVRRRISEGHTLNESVSEDNLFFLAFHPELIPVWRQAVKWDYPIRHMEARVDDGIYSERLAARPAGKTPVFALAIQRKMEEPSFAETLEVQFKLTNSDTFQYDFGFLEADAVTELKNWFAREWREFTRVHGIQKTSAPKVVLDSDGDELATVWNDPDAPETLIAFYAYLFEKYPTVIGSERPPENSP